MARVDWSKTKNKKELSTRNGSKLSSRGGNFELTIPTTTAVTAVAAMPCTAKSVIALWRMPPILNVPSPKGDGFEPASDESRAPMFIAPDKLHNQALRQG
jgi:hypothetical protein